MGILEWLLAGLLAFAALDAVYIAEFGSWRSRR